MTHSNKSKNAYLLLAQLISRGHKLQDAIKAASPEQVEQICKQASNAIQFLMAIGIIDEGYNGATTKGNE